jgi:GNAT superfamily N-acetyltransferase
LPRLPAVATGFAHRDRGVGSRLCDHGRVTSPIEVRLRAATATKADDAFVAEMARHACVIEDWPLPEPDSDETRSVLPGDDDVIVVAVNAAGTPLGAAWTFRHDPPLVTDGAVVPELAMAVSPEYRGRGVGGLLLDELSARCTGRCEAVCLNVHVRNPAVRLYERSGFEPAGQGRGALGLAMRKTLSGPQRQATPR